MTTLFKHYQNLFLLIFINILFLSVNLYAANKSDFADKKYEFGENIHDTSKVKLLNDISWKFLNNNLDSSFYYVNEAINISRTSDLLHWLSKSYNTLGVAYWYKGDLDSALYIFKQALAINRKLGRSAETARNLGNIGMLHDNLGRLDSALLYYERSLKYFEENNDKLGIAKTYVNMALIHSDLKRYDKAIDYNDKAIELYNEIKFKEDIPRVLGNKGIVLVKKKELENALTVFFEALSIAEQQNNLSVKSKILGYIGNTYTKLKQYDDAYEYISKSLEIHRQLNEKISETESLILLGDLLINSKKYSIARDTLQKGLSIAKKLKNKNLIIGALQLLSDVYLIIGDYKNAFYAKEEFSIYNDSVINEKFAGQLANFQVKYETAKKEKEIEIQKAEIGKKKSLNRLYLILLIVVGSSAITIGLLYRKKQLALNKLVEKNYELAIRCDERPPNAELQGITDKQREIYEKLKYLINNEKIYKDMELTLDKLSKKLDTNRTELSFVINRLCEYNYTNFINNYRVRHAVLLLSDPSYLEKHSVIGVAMESGFKSLSVFYKTFKENTGLTPIDFQKKKIRSK